MSSPQPSWFEHVDLMQAALVCALGFIVYFVRNTMMDIQNTQKLLFRKYDELRNNHDQLYREFTELRGQHRAVCVKGTKNEDT
jgi:hypothetical protein